MGFAGSQVRNRRVVPLSMKGAHRSELSWMEKVEHKQEDRGGLVAMEMESLRPDRMDLDDRSIQNVQARSKALTIILEPRVLLIQCVNRNCYLASKDMYH